MVSSIATAFAVAIVVCSCGSSLKEAEKFDLSRTPVQTVENMFAVKTEAGVVKNRMESALMQRFDTDSSSLDVFLNGFAVYAYTEAGLLETVIMSDKATHETFKKSQDEVWCATGNVSIQNVIKQQTMETDTLYWDMEKKQIYTDCYVRMYSSDGLMQGYGMRSDDRGSDAIIFNPFNTFGVVVQDTTVVKVDSVNFIGPFVKKK